MNQFISFEGIEGVGKSTGIQFVADLLKAQGQSVLLTREPGGTLMGEAIRDLLLAHRDETVLGQTELLLLFAGRAQHVEYLIKPALEKGQWVLSDRFTESSFAYQGGGHGLGVDQVRALEKMTLGDFRSDLVILLDLPVDLALARMHARAEQDRIESQQSDFFERARRVYLDLAQADPQRFVVVDATQPLSDVKIALKKILMERFFND